MRVIIVGFSPTPNESKKKNSSMERLNRWTGYLGVTDRFYLYASSEMNATDSNEIEPEKVKHLIEKSGIDKVIALGKIASKMLSDLNIKHGYLPHPSPRNRQLNDCLLELDVLQECYEYLHE